MFVQQQFPQSTQLWAAGPSCVLQSKYHLSCVGCAWVQCSDGAGEGCLRWKAGVCEHLDFVMTGFYSDDA